MARKGAKSLTKANVGVPSNFDEAVNYLKLKVASVEREGLSAAVNIISEYASDVGLREDTLNLLVDTIGSCKFSVIISKKLISCLTPSVRVPQDAIISALSWICTRTMSLTLQVLLMQWIVACYSADVIDQTDHLHLLYNVVFCLLQYRELCPHACHFLFLLTRKENITLYHIHRLVRLQSKLGSQPYIVGLLNIYHQFLPEYLNFQPRPLKCFRAIKQWQHLGSAPHRGVPSADGSRFTVTKSNREELVKYQGLVSTLQSSKNTASVLNSRHRRLLITSCKDTITKLKLHFALQVDQEWDSGSTDEKGRELLRTIASILLETHEDLKTMDLIMHRTGMWDGAKFYLEMLRLLPHVHTDISTFDDLMPLLEPLNTLACTSSADFKIEFISNLLCLFKNCVLLKYSPTNGSELQDLVIPHALQDLLLGLASYVDNQCILGSMQHPEKECLFLFVALDFYSLVLHLIELGCLNLLIIPSSPLVSGALFSFSASHLSQLCHLLTRYKNAATKIKSYSSGIDRTMLQNGIDIMNGYILEVCSTLWKSRGFISRSSFCICKDKLPIVVQDTVQEVHKVFTAYRHPALLTSVMGFLERNRDVDIQPRDIVSNKSVRNAFLQHISGYHYEGIIYFVQTFMRSREL